MASVVDEDNIRVGTCVGIAMGADKLEVQFDGESSPSSVDADTVSAVGAHSVLGNWAQACVA